ncbi:hypothetical protein [Streptomyces soliscabiei]|uniref:hypothetical protein n=1 Tax=Streptomyces soliscabiei TaxID=588897 RepID=UPI0029B3C384|nr:hypothetical protein [Streptomyces sp. NY05-11A]MDX2677302.1 hypothetical protein [Streptomyces sp. NY05-11A]
MPYVRAVAAALLTIAALITAANVGPARATGTTPTSPKVSGERVPEKERVSGAGVSGTGSSGESGFGESGFGESGFGESGTLPTSGGSRS